MSKKLNKDGKFVERTPEEEVRFRQLKKSNYFADVGTPTSKKPKSKERFAKITDSQFGKWMQVKSYAGVRMFPVLAYQWFKHWDQPFQMSAANFAENGFSRTSQKRALAELERVGLISVERKPPRPPTITVL